MIPFDAVYLIAETLDEAVTAYREELAAGRSARYFGGGTEIVTLARGNKLHAEVFIDYKRIPECRRFEPQAGYIGAAVRLNQLVDAVVADGVKAGGGAVAAGGALALLALCAGGVADRTVRNSITVGGNIAGQLPYREAVLPFLLFEARARVVGPQGARVVPLRELLVKRLQLAEGELLYALEWDPQAVAAVPTARIDSLAGHFYRRRTADSRVDYPLVTVAMMRTKAGIRAALAGACGYPVRSAAAEAALNEPGAPGERAAAAVAALEAEGAKVRADHRASADYRRALLVSALAEGLSALEVPK